ncbi:MAG: 2-dehydropantoate 2-reductase [Thermodesulfobacteriota bacterium]
MNITIVGPGALGCLFGVLLARHAEQAGQGVRILDHNPERAELLNRVGLSCTDGDGEEPASVPVSASPSDVETSDVVIFCVKSYTLNQALDNLRPHLRPETLLLFLQNGISHLDIQERLQLAQPPAYGVSSEGATLLGTGKVRHGGHGITRLGFLSSVSRERSALLTALSKRFDQAGIKTSLSADILGRIWQKLFVNIGINPLTAIYNRSNGQLLTSCAARSRLKNLVREAEEVAKAKKINIHEDPVNATLSVCRSTARNISSMLQDVRSHRQTEIEAISGALIREAQNIGIQTPYNDKVYREVKAIEERQRHES